ncbi:NAD(P)/FAD-dependent oxidoreductase [Streptomyces sp. NPDC048057]|uniref:NAD(P)/FAD-dependent oxidoreductase n=1 Tax=Streptomyces sp. NPDC048057 TaxID=3155628 RepID=UPI0033FD494A
MNEATTKQYENDGSQYDDSEYDVVVVGGGAAGLSAALVLGRARRRVAVVDAAEPRNAPAAHMHGYLSRDGLPPATLLELGRAELERYGVRLLTARVDDVRPADPGYAVHLAGGPQLTTRHVVVATGLRDELPDLPGMRERWGMDVLHCPYCHGWEVRDQPLGVLATRPGSVHQALLVRQWSDDVVFFANTVDPSVEDRERLAARGVRIVEGAVERIAVADGRLRGVELADGRALPRAAVFVAPRFVPHDTLLTALGCATADGWVTTDPAGRTSVPGVWATGNVVDPRAQVITAAGTGASLAFALNAELVEEDVRAAVAGVRVGV